MKSVKIALLAGVVVGLSLTAAPDVAQSQPAFDHLKCYKMKDSVKFKATATLTPEQSQFVPASCDIVGKGRFFCVPTDKDLTAFTPLTKPPIPQEVVNGQVLSDDRICYKIKCPATAAIAPLTVTDQFGTRPISFGKKAMKAIWMCTPTLKACKDAAGPTCNGFCPAGQTCQWDPTGCNCVDQQPPTCLSPGTQAPQCDGTCPLGEICVAQGNCTGTALPCLSDADCTGGAPCINQDQCDCQPSAGLPCGTLSGPPMCYGDCATVTEVCVDDGTGQCVCQ